MMSKIRKLLSKFKKSSHSSYENEDVLNDNSSENIVNEDNTDDILIQNNSDTDNHITPSEYYDYDIDLDQKLSFKDKAEISLQKIKNFFSRVSFAKLKTLKTPNENTSDKIELSSIKGRVKNFDISKVYNELFSPEHRTIINKTFLCSVFIILTYIIGSSISNLIKPGNGGVTGHTNGGVELDYSRELNKRQVMDIKNAKIFKTDNVIDETNKVKTPIKEVEVICKEATRNTNLPIKLINTVVLQDTVKSIASVQIRNSDLQNVREGDKIDNIAEVGKIDRLGLIIKNLRDGGCEKVESSQLEPTRRKSKISVLSPTQSKQYKKNQKKIDGIINNGNNFTIKKSFLEEKMADISTVITQAKGIQIANPDGTLSFKIVDVDPGGVFAYLGIQDNDVITNINGSKINDLNEVMNLFSRITNIDQLKLTVIRGGSEVPLEYKFK